ncbi:MAG: hypothetical protein DHS20C01_28340 [marine bacterium B5-7]|nr:MAG: hypothetical protein DHS20C01_28340 [marine bacterium B5-7]
MSLTKYFLLAFLASTVVLTGCASDGAPVADPSAGVSGRKHYGEANEISFLKKLRGDTASASSDIPAVGDPEYQEYLEWKRWQEFKAYQEWKKNNPGAAAADTTTTQ